MIIFESSCDKCVHNDVCALKNDIENEKSLLNKLEIFRIDAVCKCNKFDKVRPVRKDFYHPLERSVNYGDLAQALKIVINSIYGTQDEAMSKHNYIIHHLDEFIYLLKRVKA